MHKTLLSTSALRILPLRWPRAACGKLCNSCGHVVWHVDQSPSFRRFRSTFYLPHSTFRILPIAQCKWHGMHAITPSLSFCRITSMPTTKMPSADEKIPQNKSSSMHNGQSAVVVVVIIILCHITLCRQHVVWLAFYPWLWVITAIWSS